LERGAGRAQCSHPTRHLSPVTCHPQPSVGGFSLVEVTIAIGIFAFVIVGILGLLPAGLRLRADSAAETRGVLISQELFSSILSSPSMTNVIIRDGPGLTDAQNQPVDLLTANVVVGYPPRTTVPFFLWGGKREVGSPDSAWVDGTMPAGAVANSIDTLARLTARAVPGSLGLYQLMVEVRAPANVPLTNTRPISFTTLFYSP